MRPSARDRKSIRGESMSAFSVFLCALAALYIAEVLFVLAGVARESQR